MALISLKKFKKKLTSKTFEKFYSPVEELVPDMPEQKPGGNKPIEFDSENQLKALVYYHIESFESGRHLLQELNTDDFAKSVVAPEGGVKKSTFFDAINERGLDQFSYLFEALKTKAVCGLPSSHEELGKLTAIDGSLIDSVLSMYWADYRDNSKKAKAHVGFDLNKGIPCKIFLEDGNSAERPFVDQIIEPGETSVADRGYQSHKLFDQWQHDEKHYVCRIKANTSREILQQYDVKDESIVFFDAKVFLGSEQNNNKSELPLRLVGYRVDETNYWIATDRFDLDAEQIAFIYKLRWEIESFFAWWKRHLKVYHLIARSKHGLMVQLLAGLITYLLLSIYCQENFSERVSIKRVRQLRIEIRNESRNMENNWFVVFLNILLKLFAIF